MINIFLVLLGYTQHTISFAIVDRTHKHVAMLNDHYIFLTVIIYFYALNCHRAPLQFLHHESFIDLWLLELTNSVGTDFIVESLTAADFFFIFSYRPD